MGPETKWGGKRDLKNFFQRERGPNKNKEGETRGSPIWTGLGTNLKAIN